MIVGLHEATSSRLAVFAGIVVMAIADGMADAAGILTFAIPILIFELGSAIIVDVVWGILLLVAVNMYIAKKKNKSATRFIIGHVFLALVVITISYFIGKLIAGWIK